MREKWVLHFSFLHFCIFLLSAKYYHFDDMVDLEEAILKQNVPGKYTSWTGEDSDRRQEAALDSCSDDDSEDDEFYFKDLPPMMTSSSQQQQQQAATTMPLRPSGNTGVKGVIADYKEAKREEQLQKAEERLENMKRLQRATQPAIRPREESNGSEMKLGNNDSESDDGNEYDDIDDEFVKQFRMQRLAQLQNKSNSTQCPKVFGTLSSKTPEEYVELIDDIDPHVFVIVHLYEPSISESRMLHAALDKVAQIMEYANFIEVHALAANPNLDLISLPAILIYKGGTLVHNMIKFTDGLPKAFTVNDVKESLESVGVV